MDSMDSGDRPGEDRPAEAGRDEEQQPDDGSEPGTVVQLDELRDRVRREGRDPLDDPDLDGYVPL